MPGLYSRFTADDDFEPGELDTALAKQTAKRKAVVYQVLQGVDRTEIAKSMGIKPGTTRSVLRETMWAIYKIVHALPRYHRTGRRK